MLSEALQRNAKPRKRGDFRHPKDGIYAAKHEARLSNISDSSGVSEPMIRDSRFAQNDTGSDHADLHSPGFADHVLIARRISDVDLPHRN